MYINKSFTDVWWQVASGTRYVLAMWFTCSEAHQYEDEDSASDKQLEKVFFAPF